MRARICGRVFGRACPSASILGHSGRPLSVRFLPNPAIGGSTLPSLGNSGVSRRLVGLRRLGGNSTFDSWGTRTVRACGIWPRDPRQHRPHFPLNQGAQSPLPIASIHPHCHTQPDAPQSPREGVRLDGMGLLHHTGPHSPRREELSGLGNM